MTSSVGRISFGVGVDASRIAAELQRALVPVQARLNRDPLQVPVEIDTRTAVRAMQRELAMVRPEAIEVRVDVDLSDDDLKRLRQAATAIDRLESKTVAIDFSSTITDDQVRQIRQVATAMRRLESKTVAVDFTSTLTDEQIANLRGAANAIRRLESKNIVIRVDIQADEARLRALAEVLRGLRDRNLRVGVRADSGPVDRLAASLGRLGKYVGIGSLIAAGLGAILGAAGAAAGAVGGLVAGLAAVGPAVAAIGATAVVGFQGIGDTFSALSDISANAASDARAQSEAVASAQDALTSATDQAADAQRALSDAQETAADAAKDVADAYKTAQERLDNYHTTLREASLDEREAALALREAQEELAKGGFTDPTDRERALLRVERAEINLQKAQKASRDLQEEANDAWAKGVEQSDEVVAARKNQAQADRAVEDAQRNLVRSNQAVAKAAEDLAKAQSGASASSEKFADALARLSPNAQSFVLAARDLAPAWEAVRKSVQDSMFENLGNQLRETADVVLPALREGMGGVATELNLGAQQFLEFIRSGRGIEALNASFASGANLLSGLRSGTGEFTQGLIDLTTTAAPHMDEIGRSFAAIGEGIGRAFSRAADTGLLDSVLLGFTQVMTSLGPLLDGILTSFMTMAQDVMPALAPLFEQLGATLVAIAPSLGSIGAVFLNSLTSILPALGDLITALAQGLEPVLPVVVGLLKAIGAAIQPLIEPFSRVAIIVGEVLINTLKALEPALEPLATAFADLLQATAPLLPLLAEMVAMFVSALAPALSEIFNALGPVIRELADQLRPVIAQLAPILAQVAMTIGVAIANAIRQLAPILPPLIKAWTDLFLAITPLLPELATLWAELLPPLVNILVQLAPVIVKVIEAFTWLVENVIIPLVIPIIQQMMENWRTLFEVIGSTINFAVNTVFPKIGEGLNTVKNFFSDAVDTIKNVWAGLQDAAAIPVNFVIETVLNNGLFKAWNGIDTLLGGVLPDAPTITPIPRRATGGPAGYIHGGTGNGTKDDILTWLSNGEHVVTATEVIRAGGHNVLMAIRDMIFRGIPFTWDGGKVISELGRDNLSRYGAAVGQRGLGNVPPEGLFDAILPKAALPGYRDGGPVLPWMKQLLAGHKFAKEQHGRPYQWAGPRFVGDSFDCSGFMASIAAVILGQNPWQRYWATSSFGRGQRAVGPQGFVAGVDAGFTIGVTDDPGGPGGGHTAGTLGALPDLGIPVPVNVESGGALGNVHYGGGPDPRSFLTQYHLPIGANGFFQPGTGGGDVGPSPRDQADFITRVIERMIRQHTGPVRELAKTIIGEPPPSMRAVPLAVLDTTERASAEFLRGAVGGLGPSLLPGVWQRAQDLGDRVLDLGERVFELVTPFDNGGVATGTGYMPKNVLAPERVLSPEQTALFEALVQALQQIAGAGAAAAGQAVANVVVDLSQASVEALRTTLSVQTPQTDTDDDEIAVLRNEIDNAFTTTGELISETVAVLERTETSNAEAAAIQAQQQMDMLLSIAGRLSSDVLGPVMSAAVNAGTGFIVDLIEGLSKDVVTAVNGTTTAVNNLGDDLATQNQGEAPPPFGAPGSAFDAVSAISDAVVQVANTARQAFEKVAADIANAALAQTPSRAAESRGLLGRDISGGFLVDLIVRLTGVEIEVLDTLEKTYDEIVAFRGDAFSGFTANGDLISDTAALIQRNQSSIELAASEQERIQKALIKAVLKYLITSVLIPILTAILGAMITLVTTAIGAAIGAAIPVIGPAIGAAIGAVIGASLAGLAAVFTSLLAVGAGAALDAFDSGGVANGVGYMPKNTLAPERVLSPRQTTAFETLVGVLDRGYSGNRTVMVGNMNIHGRDPAPQTADNLLSLLYT